MDKHTFKVLEYNLVIEKIAGKTTCIYGRQTVLCRMPQKEIESIERLQEQTREALSILDSTEPLSVGEMDPVDKLLEMASKEIPLQGSDIRRVYQTLERSSELKGYLDKREAILPEIYRDSLALTAFPALEREIVQKVGSDGRILDRASSELARLRREDEVLQGRIRGHLEGFLKNPDYLKMLQEPIITSREHRHVLPVKQEYRSQFPGIALDSSASGATVFMEPLSVLKLTNELKYVRNQEIREEEKIRLDLTRRISCCREDLLRNLEFIGHYDALQAAARYIIDSDCIIPKVVKDPVLNLKSARHPLLEVKPVPVDIRVGEDFAGLVITGPNTGGKTVTSRLRDF